MALAITNAKYRDSRDLARALTMEPGAIADFQAYVEAGGRDATRRQVWIAALLAGKDPFTAEVLAALWESD